MKILERIKKGLSEFNKALGPDIEDENENDYPADIKGELVASNDGRLRDLEQAQEQLWASKTTKRSQLANELSVHEDGTIKGLGSKEQEKENATSRTTRTKRIKQVDDSERIQ